LAEESGPGVLGDVGQMNVDVFHLAIVDPLATGGVGLVGQAQLDTVDFCQCAVQFRCGGCAGPDADPEPFIPGPGGADVVRQGLGHRLRVTRTGEATHAYVDAGGDQCGGVVGAHDAFA